MREIRFQASDIETRLFGPDYTLTAAEFDASTQKITLQVMRGGNPSVATFPASSVTAGREVTGVVTDVRLDGRTLVVTLDGGLASSGVTPSDKCHPGYAATWASVAVSQR
jgi:hypothetical protein